VGGSKEPDREVRVKRVIEGLLDFPISDEEPSRAFQGASQVFTTQRSDFWRFSRREGEAAG